MRSTFRRQLVAIYGAVVFSVSFSFLAQSRAIDLAEIEHALKNEGLVGWVHGAAASQNMFVMTYRNPNDFFDHIEMSLVAYDSTHRQILDELKRHDRVRVKGDWLGTPSAQKHIEIDQIEIVQAYDNPYRPSTYQHVGNALSELGSRGVGSFLVHAIAADGRTLVVEHKDQVLPVFVERPEFTRALWRNDVVRLAFISRGAGPNRPMHLGLDSRDPQPVQVTERVQALHNQHGVIEGALILFPQAPGIRFNVFAVQQELPGGLSRQYTLVNFDDPDKFTRIRQKLQSAWDLHPSDFQNGRNKLVHRTIRVRASGTFNVVDPNQANPQILLSSPEDVVVVSP